jgi:antitoxin HicB
VNEVRYPAVLSHQENGAWLVEFPDVPGALSEGDSVEEALFNGAEALTGALEVRLERGEGAPQPSDIQGAPMVAPATNVQAAILIREARGDRSMSDVARALDTSWPAAARLEDPAHWPSLRTLSRAAAALGKRLVLRLE